MDMSKEEDLLLRGDEKHLEVIEPNKAESMHKKMLSDSVFSKYLSKLGGGDYLSAVKTYVTEFNNEDNEELHGDEVAVLEIFQKIDYEDGETMSAESRVFLTKDKCLELLKELEEMSEKLE